MQHLSFHGDGRTHVRPSGQLANSQHIAIVEANICIGFAGESCSNLYSLMVSDNFLAVLHHVAREVCLFGIGASFETTCESHQINGAHVFAQGILSWPFYIPFNRDRWRVASPNTLVYKNAVLWQQHYIGTLISLQRLAQVHAENFKFPVIGLAKDLHIIQLGIRGRVSCQENSVAKIRGAVGDMIARIPHGSADGDHRRIFEIIASEHSHRVKRLQLKILLFSSESVIQIESENFGRVIRYLQTDDFSVRLVGLGQNVFVRLDQISDLHSLTISIFSGAEDVPVEVDRFIGEGDDRGNLDFVAVLYLEVLQSFSNRVLVIVFGYVERQHGTALVRFEAFHIDVPQCARGQDSTRQLQHLG